jgi:hypothetical protein
MTEEEAIKCIDDVMASTYNYDETIEYQLTSDDFDWLDKAKEALEMKQKYEAQWLNDINNPLEPLKLSKALDSEIFKLKYRMENEPEKINMLNYTIIAALQDCLNRYKGVMKNEV